MEVAERIDCKTRSCKGLLLAITRNNPQLTAEEYEDALYRWLYKEGYDVFVIVGFEDKKSRVQLEDLIWAYYAQYDKVAIWTWRANIDYEIDVVGHWAIRFRWSLNEIVPNRKISVDGRNKVLLRGKLCDIFVRDDMVARPGSPAATPPPNQCDS